VRARIDSLATTLLGGERGGEGEGTIFDMGNASASCGGDFIWPFRPLSLSRVTFLPVRYGRIGIPRDARRKFYPRYVRQIFPEESMLVARFTIRSVDRY